VHRFIFVTAMGYLTYIHLYRSFVLTQYNLDVTGLMMVSVQKLTSLAFSLHDAHSKEVINERQKKEAVRECPSVLELASYLFHFQGIITGPLCFYKDYIEFIDDKKRESKPWQIVKQKLGASTLFLTLVVFCGDSLRPELLLEAETLKLSTLRWAMLFYMMMIFQRLQYYFGWVMADAVYNASGFGYSNGQWNLMSNVYPWRLETALNFKETLDAWNCLTMAWLRRTAYEPLPAKYRTIGTYLLSAWWHGFFPGYYLTFATGALFTIAARSVRRHLRPHFQGNGSMRVLYDCITWLTNTAALTYATYPFVTLHFATGLALYRHTYFCLHIMALLAIFVLPRILPVSRRKKEIGDENNKSE